MIDKPGSYVIKSEEYHADPSAVPSLSRGIIKMLISSCPARAKQCHPRLSPDCEDEHKTAFDIGQACHSLFLEGIDNAIVVESDSWRTKDAKAERDKAYENGMVPLLRDQYDTVVEVVQAAERQLTECSELGIKSLRDEGDSELSYFWKEKSGIWCRTRLDWIQKDRSLILDYKTTGMSASPGDFAKNILATGIDIQSAFYPRGVKKVDKVEPKFVLMVQELAKPYLCSFISLSPQFQALGKVKMLEGMRIWKDCMDSGEWNGYPNRIAYLDAPPWAKAQWEERQFSNALAAQGDPTELWGKEAAA